MIRSSVPLGPGEIGAPLFDLNGRFVGIAHAALPDLGSSFILPADACLRFAMVYCSGQLIMVGLGLRFRQINKQNSFEIIVEGTVEVPGIEVCFEDCIKRSVRWKWLTVEILLIRRLPPGTVVPFVVQRDNKTVSVPIKVNVRLC